MQQTAFLNKKGVTLVEVMISLVILLFVFMGLIQASLVSINSNLRNEIRDGAASLAAEYMARAKATPIDTLAGAIICTVPPAAPALNRITANITRQVRSATQPYTVWTDSCFTDAANRNNAMVTVTVTYTNPDDLVNVQTQTINSMVKRP